MSDDESNGDDQAETEDDQAEMRADPFEQLDEDVADREGDPFEQLDDGPDDQSEDSQSSDADSSSGPEWFENPHVDDAAGDQGATSPGGGPDVGDAADQEDPVGPLGEQDATGEASQQPAEETAAEDPSKMTFDVGRRDADRTTMSGPLGDVGTREGDPFEEMGTAFEEQEGGPVDPDVVWQELTSAESRGSVGDAEERTFADVSKHSFCEQCEHFSEPPDISCNHEGTAIVEYLDMETVRVVDCPIVAERRGLEEGMHSAFDDTDEEPEALEMDEVGELEE